MGPLARMTHVQLSVAAMTALLWISWRISDRLPSHRVILSGVFPFACEWKDAVEGPL